MGSFTRKRHAVVSKLRLVCGELSEPSHDLTSSSSVWARVAFTKVTTCEIAGSLLGFLAIEILGFARSIIV
jgi:hypothetical protein